MSLSERPQNRQGLQAAAASLENAFSRLEQVRASLLQLSDRLSDSNSTLSGPRSSIGPAHDAILLSGSSTDAAGQDSSPQDNEQTNVVSEFQDSLRRAVQAQSSLTQLVEQTAALRQGHPPTSSAQLPPVRLPHRPLPPDLPSAFSMDDGVTAIGRRVAARETPSRVVHSQPNPRPVPPPLDIMSQAPVPRPVRPRTSRIPDPMVEEALSAAERASQTGDFNELRRLSQIQSQLASPGPSPLQWRQEARRRSTRASTRSGTSTTRGSGSTSSEHMSRLSMLSSFSMNNLNTFNSPSPMSPAGALPRLSIPPSSLLLEEQDELIASPTELVQEPLFVEDTPSGRSYVVRRRVDETGAERVQTLQWMEEDYDERSLLPPPPISTEPTEGPVTRRRMLNNFQERTQRAIPPGPPPNHSPLIQSVPRTRIWTSLDPDGNEIPMGEDDGLDPHLRARFYAQHARTVQLTADRYAAALGIPSSEERSLLADLSVQPSAPPAPAVASLAESKPYHRHFEATPLPMPLEDMVSLQKSYHEDEVVFYVPRHASFVGR
ncbi:hypothetical protein BKA70DRAFT_323502 [Coprinopsis sp. MPI-PUGE-AT-0042]|nr:hypothetical protein BKA70DRAFT_323502 [Coprinopsis sp. MPI-PUGE-AT-0042]